MLSNLESWLDDYNSLLEALVTIGTLVLAVITVILAVSTERMARATRESVAATKRMADTADEQARAAHEQTELTRQALNASVQPILTPAPSETKYYGRVDPDRGMVETEVSETVVSVSAYFINIGAGVALTTGAGINQRPDVGWSADSISRTILRPDEVARLTFHIPRDRPELADLIEQVQSRRGTFDVSVRYTNALGTNPIISRANYVRVDQRDSEVSHRARQTFLTRAGESEPFAASGPADD